MLKKINMLLVAGCVVGFFLPNVMAAPASSDSTNSTLTNSSINNTSSNNTGKNNTGTVSSGSSLASGDSKSTSAASSNSSTSNNSQSITVFNPPNAIDIKAQVLKNIDKTPVRFPDFSKQMQVMILQHKSIKHDHCSWIFKDLSAGPYALQSVSWLTDSVSEHLAYTFSNKTNQTISYSCIINHGDGKRSLTYDKSLFQLVGNDWGTVTPTATSATCSVPGSGKADCGVQLNSKNLSSSDSSSINSSGINSSGINSSGVNSSGINSSGINSSGINSSGVNSSAIHSAPVVKQRVLTKPLAPKSSGSVGSANDSSSSPSKATSSSKPTSSAPKSGSKSTNTSGNGNGAGASGS